MEQVTWPNMVDIWWIVANMELSGSGCRPMTWGPLGPQYTRLNAVVEVRARVISAANLKLVQLMEELLYGYFSHPAVLSRQSSLQTTNILITLMWLDNWLREINAAILPYEDNKYEVNPKVITGIGTRIFIQWIPTPNNIIVCLEGLVTPPLLLGDLLMFCIGSCISWYQVSFGSKLSPNAHTLGI